MSMTGAVLARVYVVRHGETDSNRHGIIQGQLDTQLNDTGLAQVAMTAEALRYVHFDIAFTSDLQRASKVRLNHSNSVQSTWNLLTLSNISVDCREDSP